MTQLRKYLDSRRGGISLVAIGAPGTGKSSLLGSIGEVYDKEEVQLLCPKPREINSWRYDEYGFNENAEIFSDPRWRPSLDMYEADAFLKMERRVLELYDDKEVKVVILDPYTDVVKAAAHDLLKVDKAATPRDSSDSRSFYGSLKHKLSNFTSTLVGLSSPALSVPKHVLVAVHAQPTKEEEREGGAGITFEGEVMPMIEGGHRHDFAGEFDLVVYTRIKHTSQIINKKLVKGVAYVAQIGADSKRHAKIALAPRLSEVEVENDISTILELVFEGKLK